MNELEIGESDGHVVISPAGFTTVARASVQILGASGATLLFDVAEPRAGLWIELTDPAAAAGWLPLVYPAAAAALEASPPASSAPEAGPLYDTITRLMTAIWLHRSWPDQGEGIRDIDLWMLDAEAAELAWAASDLFSNRRLAESLVLPHSAEILAAGEATEEEDTGRDDLVVVLAKHVTAAAQREGVELVSGADDAAVERDAALRREPFATPEDEYDAFRLSHLVEGIVRMRLQVANAAGGAWKPSGDATAPFAAEIVAAHRASSRIRG